MELERWEKVKEVLVEALEQPIEKRKAFLDGICGGEDWLRAEVESLLEPADEVGDFIEKSPVPRPSPEAEDGLPVERRLGHYEIVKLLGRGGMGVVYLAERADEDFEQKVAVKVVKRGMDTVEIVSRFRHERRILAQLVHPHIARLFDGGETPDGLPYFVMEHVEGQPIREYCAEHDLSVNESLRLFLDVCGAVHFAHQNLVVHRDLKPANILVTEDGTVKLLDFGVARLLGDDGPSELTQLAGKRFTPEYASPEQFRGQTITTASDVYSLGIVLYELLTGRRPFDDETTEDFLVRATRHQDPNKPSVVLKKSPTTSEGDKEALGKLRRRLSGDLDHIVLKALRSDPNQRYGSVEALAEDIRRHLTGYPVAARQGANLYVMSRFLRRNWRSLSAAAAAVVVPMIVVGLLFQQASEREWAQHQFVRAEGIRALLQAIFGNANPANVSETPLTVRESLDKATHAVLNEEGVDPEDRVVLLNALGLIYINLDEAGLAETLFKKGLDLRLKNFGEDHPFVGESMNNLGLAFKDQNRFAEADEMFRKAIEIGQRFDADSERLPTYLNNLAGLEKDRGSDLKEVIRLYEESLKLMRAHYGQDATHDDIAMVLANLGSIWLLLGDSQRAEPFYLEALDIRQRRKEVEPLSTVLHHIGAMYRDREDCAAAEEYLTRSLKLRQQVHEEQSDHSLIASVKRSLGVCQQILGHPDEAERLFQEALKSQRKTWPDGHLETAYTLREIAQLSVTVGDHMKGEAYAMEAVEMLGDRVEEGHWALSDSKSVLGGALLAQGRIEEAAPLIKEGLAGLMALRPEKRQVREAKERLEALEKARAASTTKPRG